MCSLYVTVLSSRLILKSQSVSSYMFRTLDFVLLCPGFDSGHPGTHQRRPSLKIIVNISEKRMSQNVPELMPMKKSQPKRSTKRSTVRKQLAEWSLAIRTRDGHVCAICGRSKNNDSTLRLNAHHILPKKFFPEYQFETWNGISLCPKCHTFGKFSAHKNGVFFSEWLKHNRPEQYDEVVRHLNSLNS